MNVHNIFFRLILCGLLLCSSLFAKTGVQASGLGVQSPIQSSIGRTQTPELITSTQQAPIYSYSHIVHPEIGKHGMVASQEKLATEIGVDILKAGGNAVDAAVAVGYALAVTLPRAGNLGGGGFMLVYSAHDDKVTALDFREKAPLLAKRDMFLDRHGNADPKLSRSSLLAVGVPGTVSGLELAHQTFGRMDRRLLLEPAIHLARNGFKVSHDLAVSLKRAEKQLEKSEAAKKVFFNCHAFTPTVFEEGDYLFQRDLGNTLELIQQQGPDAFYKGVIGKKIVRFMERNKGLISYDDLLRYETKFRNPIQSHYRGHEIYTMPLPSSGGIHLAQILNILEPFPLSEFGHNSADTIHVMAEAMKYAYADRSKYLGDSDFETVPVEKLMSKSYAANISKKIGTKKATPSAKIQPGMFMHPKEGNETTHFSVVDKWGNMVSCTYTLNFSYGNKIMVPGTGILLNNQMDDFSAKPGAPNAYGLLGGEKNAIEPEKRMLSSMTPTFVFKKGEPMLITGSPGGSRIITTVLQIISNIVDHGMSVAEATYAPRMHHQWYPEEIRLERGISPDTKALLKQKGHKLSEKYAMGSTQSIYIERRGNNVRYLGSSDPRKPGALTLGY